jgi:hypothetical protein
MFTRVLSTAYSYISVVAYTALAVATAYGLAKYTLRLF